MTPGSPNDLGPSPVEHLVIETARVARSQCICGRHCEDGDLPLTHALVGRLRRYQAEHPGHEFFCDDEGNVAVIIDWNPEHPEVRAASDLETLLDELGAGPVSDLS